MLFDPEVAACSLKPAVLEDRPLDREGLADPTTDCLDFSVTDCLDSDPGYLVSNSGSQEQILVDLNPSPFKDFTDFVIIDDFEDYYSNEEEVLDIQASPGAGISTAEEGGVHKRGSEIYYYIEPWKFRMYCYIQSVDGFMRAARAQARGSDELSPFKPESVKKKEGAKLSSVKSMPANKSCKSNKKVQGPIMLCSVRRSPRLHKGKPG